MEETFEKYCFREKFDEQIKLAFLPTVTFQECKRQRQCGQGEDLFHAEHPWTPCFTRGKENAVVRILLFVPAAANSINTDFRNE